MSFNSSSGTVNVTGNVSAVNTKYTPVLISASSVNNTTTTLGTVPANRRWIITYIHLALKAGTETIASVNLNSIKAMEMDVSATASQGLSDSATFQYSEGYILTAGQTVTCTCGTNGLAFASVMYIEEVV